MQAYNYSSYFVRLCSNNCAPKTPHTHRHRHSHRQSANYAIIRCKLTLSIHTLSASYFNKLNYVCVCVCFNGIAREREIVKWKETARTGQTNRETIEINAGKLFMQLNGLKCVSHIYIHSAHKQIPKSYRIEQVLSTKLQIC